MYSPALPPFLSSIQAQITQYQARESHLAAQRDAWRAQSRAMQAAVNRVKLEADGDICYLGELSPGCRACRAGHWDCLFVTNACNLACPFCYSPEQASLPLGSAFGTTPLEILENYTVGDILGISFSGGEPFLDPVKLLEWVAFFFDHMPGAYLWLYTNGLLAEETLLAQLGQLGLNEIRFDAAATGYDHPVVLQHMAAAARCIPNVTVEIPAIPEQSGRLLNSLAAWSAVGVSYLNLHELIYEPGSPAARLPGPRQEIELPDGHHTAIHPLSRALTCQVMVEVDRLGLDLNVNDCSTAGKLLQIAGRRRLLARQMRAPHEKVTTNGMLETLALLDHDAILLMHPDELHRVQTISSTVRAARLTRLGPLFAAEPPLWVDMQWLE